MKVFSVYLFWENHNTFFFTIFLQNKVFSPSIASPLEIFFRHLVMSAAVRGKEAEMLTNGREPDEESSAEIGSTLQRDRFWKRTYYTFPCHVRCASPHHLCPLQRSPRNQTSQAESVQQAKTWAAPGLDSQWTDPCKSENTFTFTI